MVDARNFIRSVLFQSEKSEILTEETNILIDSLAEGIVWDFLNTDLSDIIHGGAAAGLKKSIKSTLDKTIGKDNKRIVSAIDQLKKAYGDRLSKLQNLKNKISDKISKNKTLSDTEKSEIIKAIQDRIDDSSEMLRALDGEQTEISSELNPKTDVQPNQPVKPQKDQETPKDQSKTDVVEPTEVPKNEPVKTDIKQPDVNTVLKLVSKLERAKIDTFKSKMRTILSRNAPKLVQGALEKLSNVSESNLNEKLVIGNGFDNLARAATKNISDALRKNPNLKKKYDSLSDKIKIRANKMILSTVIRSTKKQFDDDFFTPGPIQTPEPEEMPKDTLGIEPPPKKSEPSTKPEEPEEPNDGSLVGKVTNMDLTPPEVTPQDTIDIPDFGGKPDDKEQSKSEIDDQPVKPDDNISTPPVKPEVSKKATDILRDSSLDESGKFLNEKGLITGTALKLYDQLTDPNKKIIVDFATQTLDKIINKNLKEERLTPADLGLPDDFEIGTNHKGLLKTLATAISAKVRRIHKNQMKTSPPEVKKPEVKKVEPKPETPKKVLKKKELKKREVPNNKEDAKDQIKKDKEDASVADSAPEIKQPENISTAPQETNIEPVKKPESIPEPKKSDDKTEEPKAEVTPELPKEEPTSIDDKMRKTIGDGVMDSLLLTDDDVFISKMKQHYSQLMDKKVKDDVIKDQIQRSIDRWYEKQDLLESSIRSALFGLNESPNNMKNLGSKVLDLTTDDPVIDSDLSAIEVGDLVTFNENKQVKNTKGSTNPTSKTPPANNELSPNVARKLAANENKDEEDSANFKKLLDKLNSNKKSYGIVTSVKKDGDKHPETITVQPMIGKRSVLDKSKMKLKKNGSKKTIHISQVDSIVMPARTIPKSVIAALSVIGISLAFTGGKAKSLANTLIHQNQQQSRLT